ncbi:uncharacterized protein EV420DRAFT_1759323 [Desarmillaria tabescens]|uniref:Uncharacterized protein n=1 Tax=Armillaria tabescens TaxID=1929756 RepID=A0AA39NIH4_ARMTA|nr:uncharacterized protein EV420DRAFT_1759323 [Desarmillaria tabescens]KAK0466073.1 hypothetical protein EV420DRAFT_1759323 [Desarmillaria tabescens]
MPSSITIIPRSDPPAKTLTKPRYGDIFVVEESLTMPFHKLLAVAMKTASIKTAVTPACRRIVETICSSSRLSEKSGRRRPGILCRAPLGAEGDTRPWLFLMGTFDGHDEINLPQIYQDFAITVCTNATKDEEGKFTIRTSPNWRMYSPKKTQWVVVIPMSPQSGKLPVERWMCFGDQNIPYTMEPSEFAKLTNYSRGKLKEFTGRIMGDENYLTRIAKDIQMHELKYRAQKQRQYASSRKSSQMQRLQLEMQSMQLTDSTNMGDRASVQLRSPPSKKPAASVYSKASTWLVL